MVHFVGAGPGAPDLITQRGAALLQGADCIIYAGSLVNPALLGLAKPGCAIYNSAEMTLEQVLDTMRRMEAVGKTTVRLHTGDPCLYGAIREQMDALDTDGIPYDDTPGVSSFCGAAAAHRLLSVGTLLCAAASVLAKTHRDELMERLDAEYPGYGLAGHKGYPTRVHYAALRQLGPSPVHRCSFKGVVAEAPNVK